MTRLYNDVKVAQIAKRVSKEMNTMGYMKFPNTIFLELGDNHPVLQLIIKHPDQEIGTANYIEFINEWDKLGLEKSIAGLRYPEQLEVLCAHLPRLQEILGVTIMANAAGLHPTVPVILRSYWFEHCYSTDGCEHVANIFVAPKRPLRIHGETELTRGLTEAIEAGVIDPNKGPFADMVVIGAEHNRTLMEIAGVTAADLEKLAAESGASVIDYSDCHSAKEVTEKFAKTFNLDPVALAECVGPIGFDRDYFNVWTNGGLSSPIPESVEDPEAAEGFTYAIKTGKEINLYPETKLTGMAAIEQMRRAAGWGLRKDHDGKTSLVIPSVRETGLGESIPKSNPLGRSESPVLSLALKDNTMAVVADSAEQATQLFLTMTDDDLQKYAEKTGLTMKEMQYSIAVLRSKQMQVKAGYPGGNTGKPIYFINIFDVEPLSEYDMRRFQMIVDAQKGPEHKIEQMELNAAAHKQYMSELYRLMFYAKEMPLDKRLDQLYILITHANNFSNDQMVHFHLELGEGLIGEFEAPVDRGSWELLLRLFEHARFTVTSGLEAGQDVTELTGASINAYNLGEEPLDVSERVDIFLEYQHDAFFVIPLELWNGK